MRSRAAAGGSGCSGGGIAGALRALHARRARAASSGDLDGHGTMRSTPCNTTASLPALQYTRASTVARARTKAAMLLARRSQLRSRAARHGSTLVGRQPAAATCVKVVGNRYVSLSSREPTAVAPTGNARQFHRGAVPFVQISDELSNRVVDRKAPLDRKLQPEEDIGESSRIFD